MHYLTILSDYWERGPIVNRPPLANYWGAGPLGPLMIDAPELLTLEDRRTDTLNRSEV